MKSLDFDSEIKSGCGYCFATGRASFDGSRRIINLKQFEFENGTGEGCGEACRYGCWGGDGSGNMTGDFICSNVNGSGGLRMNWLGYGGAYGHGHSLGCGEGKGIWQGNKNERFL